MFLFKMIEIEFRKVVRPDGFEPSTNGLKVRCSTS